MKSWMRLAYIGATAAVAAGTGAAVGPAAAGAAQFSPMTFVSTAGRAGATDMSCATAAFSSVQAAADATAGGGTVVVCRGTYAESVTITEQLTIRGRAGAVIDAKGQPYGIGIAHSRVTVIGLTVENATLNNTTHAPGDGILTAGFIAGKPVASNYDVIVHDVTIGNQGAGIDLNSTSGSIAARNVSLDNGVGINLSNDLGPPSAHNVVTGNVASRNPGGCGIALADHTGSGVFGNVITGNIADDNGLGTPTRPNASSGSGVILAAEGHTGGVYDNTIESNQLAGNGHGGIALHAHTKGPRFSGNRLIGNTIGRNNLRTDYKDLRTTGIYLGAAGPLRITIRSNFIFSNAIGIFAAGPVAIAGKYTNAFRRVRHRLVRIPVYAG
jgi:parallel beta-helix repeat protein